MLNIHKPVDNPVQLLNLNSTHGAASRANPAKVEDFCDKDLLEHIKLARFLFGEMMPFRREARWRDQEKWTPVFRPVTRQNLTDDHVYRFGTSHPKVIVI